MAGVRQASFVVKTLKRKLIKKKQFRYFFKLCIIILYSGVLHRGRGLLYGENRFLFRVCKVLKLGLRLLFRVYRLLDRLIIISCIVLYRTHRLLYHIRRFID